MATDFAIEAKYGRELAWEPAKAKPEPAATGEICKLTGGKDWFGAYNTECVDVNIKEAKGQEFSWFERQEARVDKIIADQVESAKAWAKAMSNMSPKGCFPANALLLKADGSTISFFELAYLQNSGAPLPEIAGWDESTNQVVYQTPSFVLDHGISNSTMLYIAVQDEAGLNSQFQVTENHPLLVERNGVRYWIKAGSLQEGDLLIGLNGAYSFDNAGTLAVEGGFGLFDLSFMTASGVETPTYLVSTDGGAWFVAHNKMY